MFSTFYLILLFYYKQNWISIWLILNATVIIIKSILFIFCLFHLFWFLNDENVHGISIDAPLICASVFPCSRFSIIIANFKCKTKHSGNTAICFIPFCFVYRCRHAIFYILYKSIWWPWKGPFFALVYDCCCDCGWSDFTSTRLRYIWKKVSTCWPHTQYWCWRTWTMHCSCNAMPQ